jgi:hypothetical protein
MSGRGLFRPADQGEVEPAVPEPLDQPVGVVLDQRDGDARVAVVEAGEEFGQDRQRAPADHAHRDLPAHQAGQVVDGQPGVATASRAARANGRTADPTSVSRTERPDRSSNCWPSSDSSRRTCALTPGCATCTRLAARVKLASSATATKYSSW